jgi:FkbM family methyltransferase
MLAKPDQGSSSDSDPRCTATTASLGTDDPPLEPRPFWANAAAAISRRLPRGKSYFIQWLCRKSKKRFIATMPKELGHYQFDCCLRDMLARDVFFAGCFAPQELSFLRGVLRPGMSFVDVGANWGLFSMAAAHLVGPSGVVAAAEADPRMASRLKSNVKLNHLTQVRVFELAAADRDSTLLLIGHDHASENWGTSRLVASDAEGTIAFRVHSRQLDSLMDETKLQSVDVLKIDVEGAEEMVLRGMDAGLKSHRYRRILLELHPWHLAERGRTMQDLAEILQGYGYRGYSFDDSPLATRRSYYHPNLQYSEFILPLDQGLASQFRHTVWISPSLPDLLPRCSQAR